MDESLLAKYPELEESHFWWRARRTLVRRLLSDVPVESPAILDVGCGSGLTAEMLARDGATVVGIDVEPPKHLPSNERIRYLRGDYLALAEIVDEYDVVLALDAVEHFEDEGSVLASLYANTKPEGFVFVTVPAYDWLWSSHDDDNRHYRRYTRRRLRDGMEGAGFVVERVGYLFAGLLPPKAIVLSIEKRKSRSVAIADVPGRVVNRIATAFFRAEVELAVRLPNFFPIGTSVVAVARRPVRTS